MSERKRDTDRDWKKVAEDDPFWGVLSHDDLETAAMDALDLDPVDCREHALRFSWEASTRQFVNALVQPSGVVPGRAVQDRLSV